MTFDELEFIPLYSDEQFANVVALNPDRLAALEQAGITASSFGERAMHRLPNVGVVVERGGFELARDTYKLIFCIGDHDSQGHTHVVKRGISRSELDHHLAGAEAL